MMIRRLMFLAASARYIARENDDPAPDPVDDPAPDPSGERTFKQADVDNIVVKRNKKVLEQLGAAEKRYEQLLQSTSLTKQEKQELQNELEQVQGQLRTKEQQAAHNAKQLQERYTKEVEETKQERDFYRQQFEVSTRDRAISDAAKAHGGFNGEQFIAILGSQTKIIHEIDEQGNKTGRLVPRVEVSVKGEDGSPVVVYKTVDEAVLGMKENPALFGNLFANNVARGIGEGTVQGANGSRVDPRKMTDAEYFANRETVQKQLGIKQGRKF